MGKLSRAERNIRWIENNCYVPEGKDVGKPVRLRDWQKRELRKIYDNPHGTRRAIISFGRKNGKTALAAFLLLLHLVGPEAVPNSQLLSAAQAKEQAAILFSLAAKCVRLSPELSPYVIVRDTIKQLFCPDLGTLYRALSAEATTAYGFSPVFVVHDELGQVRGPHSELYDALETASAAHDNPLSIIISTQARTDGDLLSILIDDALTEEDKSTVLSLYAAPIDCDPFAVESIKQANPAYGDFQNAKEVLKMAETAKRMPSREPSFRNLVLNQRVEATSPFVTRSVWEANCGEAQDPGEALIYAGLDLSSVNDLTAFVPVWEIDGFFHTRPQFWVPEFGLREKSLEDRVPYDVWHKQGFLNATPGKTIQYKYIASYLYDFDQKHRVAKIAFDRWAFAHLKPWLLEAGFTEERIAELFVSFGQGTMSMTPAMRELEVALLESKLHHGNHPVLAMCAANAKVKGDESNRKFEKTRATGRIDGMVSLTMAFGVMPIKAEAPQEKKKYQMLFL